MVGLGPRLPWNLITGVLRWFGRIGMAVLWTDTAFFSCILHGAHELIEIPRYIIQVARLAVLFVVLGISAVRRE